jgi:CRISPR-associated protein (TIGR02584 family)
MKNKQNILLCVAGATPQIITETLYDLTVGREKKERIDEIRVITTLDGRDKIMTGYVKNRPDGSPEQSLLDPENGQFFKFLSHYPQVGAIEFSETKISLLRTRDGQILEDIRTPEENELAGDQICEIVREICKDENTKIFASAAGGRKTMSIYLTLAMSLFGRAEDSLSHVLVNADFEATNTPFFYPPPPPVMIELRGGRKVSTETARIYLAPIRFIRLRGIGSDNEKFGAARNYGAMVDEAQKVLDIKEREYELLIDLKKQSAFVRGERIKLTPREFLFYLIFINKKLKGNEISSLKDLSESDFKHALKSIWLETEDEGFDWKQIGRFPKYKFAETMLLQLQTQGKSDKQISENFEDFRNAFSKVVTLICNKFKAKGVDNRYYLVSTEDGTASYTIKINNERIKFKVEPDKCEE